MLPFFPLLAYFTLFTKYRRARAGFFFLLITLAAVIFASQLGGSAGSLTFGVVNSNSVGHCS